MQLSFRSWAQTAHTTGWQLHVPAIWHPLQAMFLLAWQPHRVVESGPDLSFCFSDSETEFPWNDPTLSGQLKIYCSRGRKRDWVSEGLITRMQWYKISNKPLWYFKTCLAPDPSVAWLLALGPRRRNNRTQEERTWCLVACIQILALPLANSTTLGKSLNLSLLFCITGRTLLSTS